MKRPWISKSFHCRVNAEPSRWRFSNKAMEWLQEDVRDKSQKAQTSIWKLCVVLMLSNKVISANILTQILHKIVTHGKAVLFQTILPSWYDQHAPDGVLRVTISHSRGRDGRVNSTGKVQLCLRGWPSLHSRGGGDGGLITHTSTTHTH